MTASFPLTAGSAAEACGGALVAGDPARVLRSFSIDTRTLAPGDTFIAIVGPNFDGHTFVGDAIARGAVGVVVSDPGAIDPVRRAGAVAIAVDDTIRALQGLARSVRRASGARVVAITGSAGKTTTKEAAAAFVSTGAATLRNRGNLNNHIGLPLSLIDLQLGAAVAIVELGMNHAGEISTLVDIAAPDVRVWTNVGTAHLGFFASIDALADAKAEILEQAGAATVFVANADDPRVMAHAPGFPGRTVTFGLSAAADVQAASVVDHGVEGQVADVRTPAGPLRLEIRLPGRGHLANVLAACAVALQFQVPPDTLAEVAPTLRAGAHRGEILRLSRDIRVLDDCYNSSPGALLRTLDVLGATAVRGRKIAVLGEMLELGAHSDDLHRECGRAVAGVGVSRLLTVGGPAAAALGAAAMDAGLPAAGVDHVADSTEAAARIVSWIGEGDLVLVKGSRGLRLETVVERLKVEFA